MNNNRLLRWPTLALGLGLSITSHSWAEVPHLFTSGSPASATQVNANFANLDERLQALPSAQLYDLATHRPAVDVTTKTFSRTLYLSDGSATTDPCDRMVVIKLSDTQWQYSAQSASGTEICWRDVDQYQFINGVKHYLGWDSYAGFDTGTPYIAVTGYYTAPIKVNNNVVGLGQAWDFSGLMLRNYFDPDGSPSATTSSVTAADIQTRTLVAVEDITVPAGTFSNCLKIHRNRMRPFTNGNEMRISWRCDGVGIVKQLRVNTGRSEVRELLSIE